MYIYSLGEQCIRTLLQGASYFTLPLLMSILKLILEMVTEADIFEGHKAIIMLHKCNHSSINQN